MTAPTFSTARNDAGLLREYLAHHYGPTFASGGRYDTYQQGRRIATMLARMIGDTTDAVVARAAADWMDA